MTKYWINLSLGLGLYLLASPAWTEEGNYYKYKDKNGHTVMSNSLPAEVANEGYEIISPRGNVIEKVAPKESDADIAKDTKALEQRQAQDKEAATKRKQAEIQAHKDEILLKSFTSEADITRSRDEKLTSINILEGIVHENVAQLQKQLEMAKTNAVSYTQGKKPIPASLQKTIDDTERQIQENRAFLDRKTVEKEQIHTKYQALIERFRQIESHSSTPSASTSAASSTQSSSSPPPTKSSLPSSPSAPEPRRTTLPSI